MTNPNVSMRRVPSDKSKADIENHIKDLDARIAEAPEIAVDALTAQRKVWEKRLSEWQAKEPIPEVVKVEEPIKKEVPAVEPEHKMPRGKHPDYMR